MFAWGDRLILAMAHSRFARSEYMQISLMASQLFAWHSEESTSDELDAAISTTTMLYPVTNSPS